MEPVDDTGDRSEDRLDPETIAALHGEHARELRAFLTGVLRNAALVDDALQATFTKAIEVGHTSHEETRKGWLFRVAFNEALQIKRRARIDQRSRERIAETTETEHTRHTRHSREQTDQPMTELVRAEAIEFVRGALDTLPDGQREVVRKRIYEEKTFAVIAEEMGLPLGTVLTRMRTAMQKLAGRLRDRDD